MALNDRRLQGASGSWKYRCCTLAWCMLSCLFELETLWRFCSLLCWTFQANVYPICWFWLVIFFYLPRLFHHSSYRRLFSWFSLAFFFILLRVQMSSVFSFPCFSPCYCSEYSIHYSSKAPGLQVCGSSDFHFLTFLYVLPITYSLQKTASYNYISRFSWTASTVASLRE